MYPSIKCGTCVKVTVRREGLGDYTEEVIKKRFRHDGLTGIVRSYSDSHGLCYAVEFEDEDIAYFDPEELEVLP